MKQGGKKKHKKKKQPEQGAQAQVPRAGNFHRPASPSNEDVWSSQHYMGAGENLYPAAPPMGQEGQGGEQGRGARSLAALSLQMGNLLIAGHLSEQERPVQPPRFDSRSFQGIGRGLREVRHSSFGHPPESGEQRYSCREERYWHQRAARAAQLQVVQEARAQHSALARAGHDIKVMCLNHLKEMRRLQHQEMEWMLEIELALIDMWHCPLHILQKQAPHQCICCDHNQSNIARHKLALSKNAALLRNARLNDTARRNHMEQVDAATWGARLEAEREEGQLNFRFTSNGSYVETREDDSPYSTDRFEDDEEKQDADDGNGPPGYESPC